MIVFKELAPSVKFPSHRHFSDAPLWMEETAEPDLKLEGWRQTPV